MIFIYIEKSILIFFTYLGGESDPEPGAVQEKPKRLRLLVDVSGSMYRFNGHDLRLDRM